MGAGPQAGPLPWLGHSMPCATAPMQHGSGGVIPRPSPCSHAVCRQMKHSEQRSSRVAFHKDHTWSNTAYDMTNGTCGKGHLRSVTTSHHIVYGPFYLGAVHRRGGKAFCRFRRSGFVRILLIPDPERPKGVCFACAGLLLHTKSFRRRAEYKM